MDTQHTQTPFNGKEPPREFGPFMRLCNKLAGVDEETLRHCPTHDWDNVRAVAEIMIFTWLYQAALFFIISQRLFGTPGQFRPEFMLVAMFIASFILLIDSYMIMRTGWHLSGIEELKRGGLDVSGGPAARIKAGCFLAIRIFLSVCLAQLTAIFLSMLVYGSDISARIENVYLQANASLLANATALVDGEIKRATDAVAAESQANAALSAQVTALRQNDIDPSVNNPQMQQAQKEVTELVAQKAKADDDLRNAETFAANELAGIKGAAGNSGRPGNGVRRKAAVEEVENAKARAGKAATDLNAARARLDALSKQSVVANETTKQRAHAQLPSFESALATENAKLSALKDQLGTLTHGRNDAIRDAIDRAPDHVSRNEGFLAQIVALEHLAHNDSNIWWFILLIDFVSFGFELAAVLAKVTSFVPTTYAALLARDAYMRAVRIVDEMMNDLNGSPSDKRPPRPPSAVPANDNNPPDAGSTSIPTLFANSNNPPPPPKRRRGRPRKNTLN